MGREELIKSLRICAGGNGGDCYGCYAEAGLDCSEKLMQAAADMLEQDESLLHECVKPSIERAANVLNSMWDLLKENLAPQNEKTADEMFRELGYERISEDNDSYILYCRDVELNGEKHQRVIEITENGHVNASWDDEGNYDFFEFAEIRTVCKLLDEMGVE